VAKLFQRIISTGYSVNHSTAIHSSDDPGDDAHMTQRGEHERMTGRLRKAVDRVERLAGCWSWVMILALFAGLSLGAMWGAILSFLGWK